MEKETKKKASGRGGRREGSGRKRISVRTIAFRAAPDVCQAIDSQPNKTDFIQACIRRAIEHQDTDAYEQMGRVIPLSQVEDVTITHYEQEIAAGVPILAQDDPPERVSMLDMLSPHLDTSFLIHVDHRNGYSMIDAGVHPGDIVVVDSSNITPTPDQMAVCMVDGECTLKYVRPRGKEIWLHPDSPGYEPFPIHEDQDFRVMGVVRSIIHIPGK